MQLYLGYCLATGSPFYGLKCAKVPDATLLVVENTPKSIRDRVDKIDAAFEDKDNNFLFDMLSVEAPTQMSATVYERLRKTDARVVILDPIKYLVPGDYLKPEYAAKFIQVFLEMLTVLGMVAIITLPIKKPPSGKQESLIHPEDVYAIKGATEWMDSATTAILLEKRAYSRKRLGEEITMSFPKHRIADRVLSPINLDYDYDTALYHAVQVMEKDDDGKVTSVTLNLT